ncbi:response regulator transcription factor [Ideonella sp. TBM-1]|uniref:Response regulator transcription factor n=1 Tax=Ideonella livida TaxID=2707176 RepID=A0A7C9PKR4_9BURK|nr:response regulator transcription factor [Ideonella livida]
MPPCRVLLAEDQADLAANVIDYLSARGHAVDWAPQGGQALQLLEQQAFDLLLLDLGLPGLDGLGVLQALRHRLRLGLPVLVLTARDQLASKQACFEAGADDYLVKPFALSELAWRVQALHRRARGRVVAAEVRLGPLALDRQRWQLQVHGQPLHLPPRAMQLLERLLQDAGQVVTRADLEAALWPGGTPDGDALRSQVHLLRRALGQAGYDGLQTVHGVGWRLAPGAGGDTEAGP